MTPAFKAFDFSCLSDNEAQHLLETYDIRLAVSEARKIQNHFLKRPPSLAELILWSIQGSEHCSYKSTRTYLKTFNTKGPHVILGPSEDAGIVQVAIDHAGRRYGIVMSHESHNHPSQIVPYEGAATGVGGNVRDVCCMGAEVIAIADGLRFGDLSQAKTHFIQAGVVKGIGGYGNPLGIPCIGGDLYYHPSYNDNCLVTVLTLGVVREDHIIHSYAPKNAEDHVFILVGKPTDNSGFGGASFASSNLEADSQEKNKGAVQEPNAFLQRHLLKANGELFKKLREQNLLGQVGFKDLGAGGIACASVELADAGGYGADINLDLVPVSIDNLSPAVILCSETQERFMWVVPPTLVEMILSHYNQAFDLPNVSVGACAAVIGNIRTDGLFTVKSDNIEWVSAKASDITTGILYDRPYTYQQSSEVEPIIPVQDFNEILLKLLAHENIASREPIFETYDKQVQGRSLVEAGQADAGVMLPFNDDSFPEEIRSAGIALSLDQNPRFNLIDPYWGAVNAVCESVRNVVAVGAKPVALTDCLCFGNPEKPMQMGMLVESIRGIKAAADSIKLKDYPEATLPIIAGNVSLYNESDEKCIPPSPMIACLGVIDDAKKVVPSAFQQPNSKLFLIGERFNECGGSVYYQLSNVLGKNVPKPDLVKFNREINLLLCLFEENLVLSAHDISEGGLAVSLTEMTFKNKIGFKIEVPGELSLEKKLFSESGGFVIEINTDQLKRVKEISASFEIKPIDLGCTIKETQLIMHDVINLPIEKAFNTWQNGLREKLL